MARFTTLCRNTAALAALFAFTLAVAAPPNYGVGHPATPEDIKLWNIDVRPDGAGLPEGKGTVDRGKTVYNTNCLGCHGLNGQGGIKDRLVGGQGSLATDKPVKTIGSFWPYATTLFDYIHRAMPYTSPGSLSIDDTYAVEAYLLNLNGILPDGATLDKASLLRIKMPNRDGFVPEPEFVHVTNSR